MVKMQVYGTLLAATLLSCFIITPLVEGEAMQRVWGRAMTFNQYFTVGNEDEIPSGNWGYVFQKQGPSSQEVSKADWERLLSGDLSQVAAQIKKDIPGCEPTWIRVSWEETYYSGQTQKYVVKGFMVEALIENVNAGLTGAEIVLILLAAAILTTIVTLCLTGSWTTWKILEATEKIGPWLTVAVGLAILGGIGFLLWTFLGGKAEYKSKGKRVAVGTCVIFRL